MAGIAYAAPTNRVERTILPEADSTYDLGSNTVRWANIYGDTFYGDGSNLTGISGTGIENLNSETLGSIGDVSTTSLSTFDTLIWDGTNWVSSSTPQFDAITGNLTGNVVGNLTGNADTATNLADYSSNFTWTGINTFSSDLRATGGLHATTTDFDMLQVNGNGLITGTLGITGQLTSTSITNSGIATTTKLCFPDGECMTSPATFGDQIIFYPHNTDSDVATYEEMFTYPDGITPIDESCTANTATDNGYCTIDTYISTSTDIAITNYPAGTTRIHASTYVSSVAGDSRLVFKGYKRTALGVETELGTATSTEINNLTIQEALATFTGSEDFAFNADGTDRLVLKVMGWTDSAADKVIHWTYQTTGAYSQMETPITLSDSTYTRSNVSETITAEWTFSGGTNFGLTTSTNSTSTNLYISNDLTVAGDTSLQKATSTFFYASGDITAGGSFYGTLIGDLTCTDCLNATEIEDIYLLDGESDTMTGTLTADGFTLGSTEILTIGTNLFTHDGTDFTLDDTLTITGYASSTLGLNTQGTLHVGGNSTFDGTGHDSFSDFVANEHLDWTGSVGTIHADNYTNTTYTGGTNLTLDGTEFNVDDAFLVNSAADTTAFGLTMGSATTSDTLYIPTLGVAAGTFLAVDATGLVIATTTPSAAHDQVTLAGQDYLTLSGQEITAGEIEPDDLGASDFGEFTCNGTTCVLEATNTTLTTTANLTTVGALVSGSLAAGFTDVVVAQGGSGASTFTDHGVLVGSGTDPFTVLSVGTNGQLLIGSTGADPVFATLNCDSNLTCTTGAGTLEIDLDNDVAVTGYASSTTSLNTQGTLHVGSNGTVEGTLGVTGVSTFNDSIDITGNSTTTGKWNVDDGTNGMRVEPGATTSLIFY